MSTPPDGQAPEGHAQRLARGALFVQIAQVARLASGLIVVMVLARELTLAEFGLYTLLLSFITYILFLRSAVTNAAVISIAGTGGEPGRVREVASSAFALYAAIGLAASLVLLVAGELAIPVLNVPEGLETSARIGVVAVAVAVALGWPSQVFDDVLRGLQRFEAVSVLELGSVAAYTVGAVTLALLDAPVWSQVAWAASLPLLTGIAGAIALRVLRIAAMPSRRHVRREDARKLGGVSSVLALGGIADLLIYSVDRAILSAFRSPATVGLYEAPLGAQNLVRFFNGVMTATVVPASSGFLASDDAARLRRLFLRGLKYSLAATLPFVVVLTVTPGPVLETWLGEKFGVMAEETAVFCAFWALGANGAMAGSILIGLGRARDVTIASWAAAAVNVPLMFLLVPDHGIWGTIVAAVAALAVSLVYQFVVAVRALGVRWGEVVRRAWLPGYSIAVVAAAALWGVTEAVEIDGLLDVAAVLIATPAACWAAFWLIWLDPAEREIVRRLVPFGRR